MPQEVFDQLSQSVSQKASQNLPFSQTFDILDNITEGQVTVPDPMHFKGSIGPTRGVLVDPTSTPAPEPQAPKRPNYVVFCDLDGTLCDFQAGLVHHGIKKRPGFEGEFWNEIRDAQGGFFNKLPWLSDGQEVSAEVIASVQ